MASDIPRLASASEVGERGTNAFGLIEKVLAAAQIGREEIESVPPHPCMHERVQCGMPGVALRDAFAQVWKTLREAAGGLPPVLPRLWSI